MASSEENETPHVWTDWCERPLLLVKLSYILEDAWDEDVEDDRITHNLPVEIPWQINFLPFRGFRDIPWAPDLFESRRDRLLSPMFNHRFESPNCDYRVGIFRNHIVAEHITSGEIIGPRIILDALK